MVMGLVAGFPLLRVDGDVMMTGLIVLAGGAVVLLLLKDGVVAV